MDYFWRGVDLMSGIQQMLTGGTYKAPIPYGWPANIGDAYGGGFFAGQINVSGTKYNLVVAPKSSGENSSRTWGTNGGGTGITSVINGPTNSASLAALGSAYQAATFCEGLTINGYSDWYLPALNELEVLYYFLKPTTDANNTSTSPFANGSNANAVYPPEPVSTVYTTSAPAQTNLGINFRTGESEAFASARYWTSTDDNSYGPRNQIFSNGAQEASGGILSFYARAVRRVLA
jgi:hypothetical protein